MPRNLLGAVLAGHDQPHHSRLEGDIHYAIAFQAWTFSDHRILVLNQVLHSSERVSQACKVTHKRTLQGVKYCYACKHRKMCTHPSPFVCISAMLQRCPPLSYSRPLRPTSPERGPTADPPPVCFPPPGATLPDGKGAVVVGPCHDHAFKSLCCTVRRFWMP